MDEILKATIVTYKDCLNVSFTQLLKNWPIIIGTLLAYLFVEFAGQFLGRLGIVGGFMMGLLQIVILTLFYKWILDTAQKQRVEFSDLFEFDFNLFQSLISVAFILWIVSDFLIYPIIASSGNKFLGPGINLVIAIILNPVAEIIAYHRYESIHAIKYSLDFITTNWIEWFLPFVIFSLPLIILADPFLILNTLSNTYPLLASVAIFNISSVILAYISLSLVPIITPVALVLTLLFAVFRAKLFIELESGSRRQRIFKAKQ